MSNRVQTVDVIRSLVSLMGVTVLITAITDNGDDTYTLETSNTYWLQPSFEITIDSEDYTVVSIVRNTSFIISGTILPTAESFNLGYPSYFHGTLIQTTNELNKEDIKNVTPMVYCYEEIKDIEQSGDSALDRISDVTLYFLTQANFKDYLTDDYLNNCHYQMRALADRFLEICKASYLIGVIGTKEFTNRTKMTVRAPEGAGKNLFNSELSGVQLRLSDFPINKIACSGVINLSSNYTLVINVHGELQSTTTITRLNDETYNVTI